jgi:hypothetical protein
LCGRGALGAVPTKGIIEMATRTGCEIDEFQLGYFALPSSGS